MFPFAILRRCLSQGTLEWVRWREIRRLRESTRRVPESTRDFERDRRRARERYKKSSREYKKSLREIQVSSRKIQEEFERDRERETDRQTETPLVSSRCQFQEFEKGVTLTHSHSCRDNIITTVLTFLHLLYVSIYLDHVQAVCIMNHSILNCSNREL